MSHLTKIGVKMTNRALMNRLASKKGWTITQEKEFVNPYSRDRVENPTVFRDSQNKVKLVLDREGFPNIDTWNGSMGKECLQVLREYTTEFVKQTAMMNGQRVVEKGTDKMGNLILEVVY